MAEGVREQVTKVILGFITTCASGDFSSGHFGASKSPYAITATQMAEKTAPEADAGAAAKPNQ
jgi:hypothetical protein